MITIGVLTPHAAPGPEVELPEMAPGGVVTQVSRIPAPGAAGSRSTTPPTAPAGLAALSAPAALDLAVGVLGGGSVASVDVLAHASTSTGYAIGFDAEAAMLTRLSQRWNVPVAGTSLSAAAALQALDVRRVALVHPPWFDDELNVLGAAYFRSQGFEVVSSESAELANDPERIEPGPIVEWVSRHLSDDAEAVVIGGNGFRAAGAIEALEGRLGRPVLESNQVLLWSVLGLAPDDVEVVGYGRLFGHLTAHDASRAVSHDGERSGTDSRQGTTG
jgi:maleate isomerase